MTLRRSYPIRIPDGAKYVARSSKGVIYAFEDRPEYDADRQEYVGDCVILGMDVTGPDQPVRLEAVEPWTKPVEAKWKFAHKYGDRRTWGLVAEYLWGARLFAPPDLLEDLYLLARIARSHAGEDGDE